MSVETFIGSFKFLVAAAEIEAYTIVKFGMIGNMNSFDIIVTFCHCGIELCFTGFDKRLAFKYGMLIPTVKACSDVKINDSAVCFFNEKTAAEA